MTQPIPDTLAAPLATALAACLCAELATTLSGPVCCCMVRHSATSPILDGCECTCTVQGVPRTGVGWVRVAQIGGGNLAVNVRSARGAAACTPGWGVTYELGVARCIPLSADGAPLPCDVQSDIAIKALSDMSALRRAVRCCPALTDMSYEWVQWLPVGPSGGCAGGFAQIRVSHPRG